MRQNLTLNNRYYIESDKHVTTTANQLVCSTIQSRSLWPYKPLEGRSLFWGSLAAGHFARLSGSFEQV